MAMPHNGHLANLLASVDVTEVRVEPRVVRAIRSARVWTCLPPDAAGEKHYSWLFDQTGREYFSRADLHHAHPDLPDLLDELQLGSRDKDHITATVVRNNYEFWTLPRLCLPEHAGTLYAEDSWPQDTDKPFLFDTSVQLSDPYWVDYGFSGKYVLSGKRHALANTVLPSGTQRVIGADMCNVWLDHDWLDAHTPGWRQRHAASRELGLSGYETAIFCLGSLLVNNAGLPLANGDTEICVELPQQLAP